MQPLETALTQLNRFQTDEALALLEAVEEKRRKESFVKYWTPTAPELKAIQAFTEKLKILAVLGGNRSGKTEVGAAIVAAWALGKRYFEGEPGWEWVKDLPIPEPPNTIWAVGLDHNVLQRVIWDEKFFRGRNHPGFIPASEVVRTSPRENLFELKNGSIVAGMSAESGREKFQSASVDLIWIDEEPEEAIFDECYQRTVDCAGKILLTLTPLTDIASGSRTPWVYNLHEDARPDVKFVSLSVLDNPFIPAEELEKLREKWEGHPEEKARLYGEFYQRSGLVYNLFAPATHLVTPRHLPDHWLNVVCIDPAPTGVTAALWAKADGMGNLYFYREYYESNLVVSAHAKNILVQNQGRPVDMWLIDPKGGSQRNAETHKSIAQLYREAGIPVRLAQVGEDFGLGESQEFIAATLNPTSRHPKAYFFNDLENFKWEISRYSWATVTRGERKGLTTEKPIKRNDHLMNCFQYICAMRPKARGGAGVESPEAARRRIASNSYTTPAQEWA